MLWLYSSSWLTIILIMIFPRLTVSASSDPLLLPTLDKWYTAPPRLADYKPGEVLRVRTVPGGLGPYDGNASAAYHILYRTTDSKYKPQYSVTTLFVPKNAIMLPSGDYALLSNQLAYNTPCLDRSPSYFLFQTPEKNSYGIPTFDEAINQMLARGWFVSVPDYEGPRASFSATVQSGHATLDGIRAVIALSESPIILLPSSKRFKYAMWGYSGGSLASGKAAELQVQYAPELTNFAGAALGGLVSSVGGMWDLINKSPWAGNMVLVILGIMNEYPKVEFYLRNRLKTGGPRIGEDFLKGRLMDSAQAFPEYAGQDIFEYFVGGRADLEDSPVMRIIQKMEWTLGYHGVPQIPLYVYKAVKDEFTSIEDTDELINSWKRYGASVLYERNTAGAHIPEIANGQGRAIEWLAKAFEGVYENADQGIVTRNVSVDIYDPSKV
ncbi:hypothetical protein M426DRAFT_118019 [Hypoxylon sp. CI-4A]|nr:hypothetical protein M426DRAFT_118019 [Hypoxylon sp. CI-4A]